MSRVSVRYMIDDVPAAMRFYTTLLGFTLEQDASPAFASVVRDGVPAGRGTRTGPRRRASHSSQATSSWAALKIDE
jgi:predicted enzyme related to lactoylglutathione lyase